MGSAEEVVLLMGKLCEKLTFHSFTFAHHLPTKEIQGMNMM